MILIDGEELKVEHFPDGTQRLKLDPFDGSVIDWIYESDTEWATLYYIVNHLRSYYPNCYLRLKLRYVHNGRMDRTKNTDEVFTLKWFTKFINDLNFSEVEIFDPHSNVTPALIDRCKVVWPDNMVNKIIQELDKQNPYNDVLLYFPDKGAYSKYSDIFNGHTQLYGEKVRDWNTGQILGLELRDPGDYLTCYTGGCAAILMIDDICSHGGSLYYSAKLLKDYFPGAKIYSYTSHTENEFPTLQKAFDEGLIEKHFTTNSLYRGQNNKIELC